MADIILTPPFLKELKRLAKKYRSLKDDIDNVMLELGENPMLGTSLGNNAYKIRLAIKSKGKGKSGGARVITYYLSEENEVYLLRLYDKAEIATISKREIDDIIASLQ